MPRSAVEGHPLYRKAEGVFVVGIRGPKVEISPATKVVRIREDAGTRLLRRRWAGRPLWGYGPVGLRSTYEGAEFRLIAEATTPVRIEGLYRLAVAGEVSIALPNTSGEEESNVRSGTPIVAFVRPARGAHITTVFSTGPAIPPLRPVDTLVWTATYANEAHLMRTYATAAPTGAALRAARTGLPSPGMTPEQAARAVGCPPLDRTPAALAKLARWHYPASTPFQSAVVFRNGRVLRYEPPGQLP